MRYGFDIVWRGIDHGKLRLPFRLRVCDSQPRDQTLANDLFIGKLDIGLLLLALHKLIRAGYGAALIPLAFY